MPAQTHQTVFWAVAEGLLPRVPFNKLAVLKRVLLQLSPQKTNCK